MGNRGNVELAFTLHVWNAKSCAAFEGKADAKSLAAFCSDPKANCPMGCFACPLGKGVDCSKVTEDDWLRWIDGGLKAPREETQNEPSKTPSGEQEQVGGGQSAETPEEPEKPSGEHSQPSAEKPILFLIVSEKRKLSWGT